MLFVSKSIHVMFAVVACEFRAMGKWWRMQVQFGTCPGMQTPWEAMVNGR